MQLASGLSLLFSPSRFFSSASAHGVSGRPPSMFVPRLPNVAVGGVPGGGGGGGAGAAPFAPARPRPRPSPGARFHSPERSGCPSAAFGVGASRFTLPFARRGTLGFVRFSHCAEADGISPAKADA